MKFGHRLAIFVLAVSFTAKPAYCADETRATLRTQGHVLADGNEALPFAAIFPNTRIETNRHSSALLELKGSRVEIGAETVVEFEGDDMRLEHGSLSVLTFQSMIVKAGCILTIPVRGEETLFTVTYNDGRVMVSAVRNDVNIKNVSKSPKRNAESSRSEQVTVNQGEQKTREDKCGAASAQSRAAAGTGVLLNSPYAVGAGMAAIGGTLCWVFCSSSDTPVSPSIP